MPRQLRINKIQATSCRGATTRTEVELPNTPICLLFGENGTGKSTLIDVIEIVCLESHGSLMDISPKLKAFVLSLGANREKFAVGITTGKQTWTGQLKGKTGFSIWPADSKPKVRILRRTKIHKLMMATGTERFNALDGLIDVGGLDAAEAELRKAIKDAKDSLSSNADNVRSAEARIAELFQTERKPEDVTLQPLEWLKSKAGVNLTAARKEKEALDAVCEAQQSIEGIASSATIGMEEVVKKRAAEKEAQEELTEQATSDPEAARLLSEILEKTLSYLDAQPESERCPACGQPVDPAQLKNEIKQRLEAQPELQRRLKAYQYATKERSTEETRQRERYTNLANAAGILLAKILQLPANQLAAIQLAEDELPLLRVWRKDSKLSAEAIEEAQIVPTRFLPQMTKIKERRGQLESEIGALESKKTLLKTYYDGKDGAEHWEKVQARLGSALHVMEDSRKAYIRRVLTTIAFECDRLFQAIHPNEGLGGIRFILDEKERASLQQLANFETHKDIPPQGCFSESHLDTLSFAFFLAQSKRDDPANTILVIDDIFTSVDEDHLWRISQLLVEEAGTFAQIIIATHLRKWMDRVRQGHGPVAKIGVVELLPRWSMERGIRSRIRKMETEDLQALLDDDAAERREIANHAGVILEGALDHLTDALGCNMPRKRDQDYSLTEMLSAIQPHAAGLKAVRQKEAFQSSPTSTGSPVMCDSNPGDAYDLSSGIATLLADKLVRNKVGSHFDEAGSHYSDGEVRSYGKSALDFVRYFLCEDCKSLIGANRKRSRTCHCGKLSIEPSRRPARSFHE